MATIQEKAVYNYPDNIKYNGEEVKDVFSTESSEVHGQNIIDVTTTFKRKVVANMNRLVCDIHEGIKKDDICFVGGKVFRTIGKGTLPLDGYRLHIQLLFWLAPSETQFIELPKLDMDEHSVFRKGLLNLSGQFFDVSVTSDSNKANCQLQIDSNHRVFVVFTKPVTYKEIIWLFFEPNKSALDEMKHARLCELVNQLFLLEMEVAIPNDDDYLTKLNTFRKDVEAFLRDIKSFNGLVEFCNKSSETTFKKFMLSYCISVINTGEVPMRPARNTPVKLTDCVFPLNHLVFACISRPHKFEVGVTYTEKRNLLFHHDYIGRQKTFRELNLLYIVVNNSMSVEFDDDNVEYLGDLETSHDDQMETCNSA
jgi:hypothetical protein